VESKGVALTHPPHTHFGVVKYVFLNFQIFKFSNLKKVLNMPNFTSYTCLNSSAVARGGFYEIIATKGFFAYFLCIIYEHSPCESPKVKLDWNLVFQMLLSRGSKQVV